ncbi:phenylacetate--CoA ligase family protein [Streptomyces sp. HM190]|uniref:phenylacetate--CoA ligase family protein n=1 Tax=Streptomyces sp. HM190 TaxID=2695266 RepID=UPI00135AB1DB|nr:phenylacetate--CoA ligase family protein [Streptomyces sp. HM190]
MNTQEARASLGEFQSFNERYYSGEVPDEEWKRWNAERLTTVLRHVTKNSPFYGRHLQGIDIERVTPDDMGVLPFTTKADLRRELHDMLSGDIRDALIYYETTGTTGPATPCPRGPKDIACSNVHLEKSLRSLFTHYFGDRKPVIGLMGPSELYSFGDTFGDVVTRIGACHAKIWPESQRVGYRKALELMRDLEIDVIMCSPAACANLAKAAVHNGFDPRKDFKVKLFLVLGEICTPEFSANVKSIWGADALPTLYGTQELMVVATGCSRGRMHLSRPNYLVEVVDPDTGESLGQEGTGELVLTMLVDDIKPLVRYRTNDLATVGPNTCDCGLPGPEIQVIGRVPDRIALGEGKFRPAEIEAALLDGVGGCLGYQVVIGKDADGGDEVTVHLEMLEEISGPTEVIAEGMIQRIRERLGVPAKVVVDPDLDPITQTGAYVSWKAARVKDTRVEYDPDVETAKRVAERYVHTS